MLYVCGTLALANFGLDCWKSSGRVNKQCNKEWSAKNIALKCISALAFSALNYCLVRSVMFTISAHGGLKLANSSQFINSDQFIKLFPKGASLGLRSHALDYNKHLFRSEFKIGIVVSIILLIGNIVSYYLKYPTNSHLNKKKEVVDGNPAVVKK